MVYIHKGREAMCCPRICGLVLSLLINIPLSGLVLSLESGSWELKLFSIPFIVSPVCAVVIYCNRRSSCLARTALVLLLLSLLTKAAGATLAGIGASLSSQSEAPLGGLGALVYGMVAGAMGVSALSDAWLFLVEICSPPRERRGSKRVTRTEDFF